MPAASPEETRLIVIGASADSSDELQLFERPDLKFVYGAFGTSPQDSVDEALTTKPHVAIVGDSPRFDRIVPTFRHLMLNKVSVVSDSGDMIWPWLKTPHLADVLANEAKRAGVAIAGVGNDPVAVKALLPLLRKVPNVSRVLLRRYVSATSRQIGFLKSAEEFRKLATAGVVGLPGVGEMAVLIAQALGRHPMRADVRTAFKPKLDNQNRVIGMRQSSAWSGDGTEIEVEHVANISREQTDDADFVEVIGDRTQKQALPPVHLADALLDAAANFRRLPPGLHTPLDLFNQ